VIGAGGGFAVHLQHAVDQVEHVMLPPTPPNVRPPTPYKIRDIQGTRLGRGWGDWAPYSDTRGVTIFTERIRYPTQ
jgi:hypothetical protein